MLGSMVLGMRMESEEVRIVSMVFGRRVRPEEVRDDLQGSKPMR